MTAPWWRPDRLAARRDKLAARGRVMRAVRDFFDADGYVEVETPALQVEPGAGTASAGLRDRIARSARRRRAAALSAYLARIRDEEAAGRRHGADLAARACLPQRRARRDASSRIRDARMVSRRGVVPRPDGRMRGAAARRPAGGRRRRAALARPSGRRTSAVSASHRRRGFAAMPASICWRRRPIRKPRMLRCSPPRRRASASRRIPATIGRRCSSAFFWSASSRISGSARRRSSTIIRSRWPRCRAANPDDPRLAERFELYVCGLELANAFGELTDPAEQRRRFLADQARKQALYGETYPIDEDFLAALDTACRIAPGSRSASTGSSCSRPGRTTSRRCCGRR